MEYTKHKYWVDETQTEYDEQNLTYDDKKVLKKHGFLAYHDDDINKGCDCELYGNIEIIGNVLNCESKESIKSNLEKTHNWDRKYIDGLSNDEIVYYLAKESDYSNPFVPVWEDLEYEDIEEIATKLANDLLDTYEDEKQNNLEYNRDKVLNMLYKNELELATIAWKENK